LQEAAYEVLPALLPEPDAETPPATFTVLHRGEITPVSARWEQAFSADGGSLGDQLDRGLHPPGRLTALPRKRARTAFPRKRGPGGGRHGLAVSSRGSSPGRTG
jgi:hypothetical protein